MISVLETAFEVTTYWREVGYIKKKLRVCNVFPIGLF
jgi:hypothetical protein